MCESRAGMGIPRYDRGSHPLGSRKAKGGGGGGDKD